MIKLKAKHLKWNKECKQWRVIFSSKTQQNPLDEKLSNLTDLKNIQVKVKQFLVSYFYKNDIDNIVMVFMNLLLIPTNISKQWYLAYLICLCKNQILSFENSN